MGRILRNTCPPGSVEEAGASFRERMLALPRRQAASLCLTQHRPWPLPRFPWLMGQSWNDLLFAHWAVAPELLLSHLPRTLRIDTRDDRAWIGITPFAL